MSGAEREFRWRPVIVSTLAPSTLFSIGEGAIIPIIPAVAGNLGATLALAGFIAGMHMIGKLIGDLPGGALVARIGERATMIGAATFSLVGLLLAVIAPSPWVLGVGILVMGIASAAFGLARHAFLAAVVPFQYRARALSALGGTHRIGYFIGPLLAAGVIGITGSAESALWVHVITSASTVLLLLILRDPAAVLGTAPTRTRPPGGAPVDRGPGLFHTVWANRGVLSTLGVGASVLMALRASRNIILPLWALTIGVDEASTALIIGIASAVDAALFYAGGAVMDRFGRLWASLPSVIGLGVGHIVLAVSGGLPNPFVWFVAVAFFLAVANGFSAGILMTLGADLADPANRGAFLGAWRLQTDVGAAAAPLIISGVTALASLPFAAAAMAVLAAIGGIILRVYVPRHTPRR